MFPLPFTIYVEIIAFCISSVFWFRLKESKLHLLPFYLLFIVVVELSARYLIRELGYKKNGWLYNISIPLEYTFFLYLFFLHYISVRLKMLTKYTTILFSLFIIAVLLIIGSVYSFNTIFLKVGSLIMIIFSILYFYDLLISDRVISPLTEPFFWICSGLLIFNVGEFAYISLSDTLFQDWTNFRSLVKKINGNLIYILYSTIIIGIIMTKWDQEGKT